MQDAQAIRLIGALAFAAALVWLVLPGQGLSQSSAGRAFDPLEIVPEGRPFNNAPPVETRNPFKPSSGASPEATASGGRKVSGSTDKPVPRVGHDWIIWRGIRTSPLIFRAPEAADFATGSGANVQQHISLSAYQKYRKLFHGVTSEAHAKAIMAIIEDQARFDAYRLRTPLFQQLIALGLSQLADPARILIGLLLGVAAAIFGRFRLRAGLAAAILTSAIVEIWSAYAQLLYSFAIDLAVLGLVPSFVWVLTGIQMTAFVLPKLNKVSRSTRRKAETANTRTKPGKPWYR